MLRLLLLSFSLSIDAFSIGLSYGLKKIKIPISATIIIFILSFIITSVAIFFGKMISLVLPPLIFKLVGVLMLSFMGIFIIWESQKKELEQQKQENTDGKRFNLIFRSYTITIKIIRDPKNADLNHSNIIEPLEALYIGTALCIDSIGVSIASVSLDVNFWLLPLFVSVMQILFLSIGTLLGHIVHFKNTENKYILFISGSILIFLGILRLF